jgi:CHAT domain-containing protein
MRDILQPNRAGAALTRRLWVVAIAALGLLVAARGSTPHMGDPLRTKPGKTTAPKPGSAPEPADAAGQYRSGSAQREADQWERRWQEIQGPNDAVAWSDHFHVCGLKYRFRIYDQLFRCLDLLEAKIAAGGPNLPEPEYLRAAVPIIDRSLRAAAYSELGEPDRALREAEAAWAAVPERFRTADSSLTEITYLMGRPTHQELLPLYYVAASIGSSGVGNADPAVEKMLHEGRNNPAALDLRAESVVMGLAVQRTLLYQRLGRSEEAKAAFADLRRWENTRFIGSGGLLPSKVRPFMGRSQMLSIGPRFGMGEYRQVVLIYEQLARKVRSARSLESAKNAFSWLLLLPLADVVTSVMARNDARLFATALEDVSNALIYAQSLVQLGQYDKARDMFDTLLALPEIRAMGNLYWATLYERGLIALREPHRDEAVRLLTQSVDAIEAVRSTISFEAAKIGFAGDKQAVYAALIGALVEAGDWQRSFVYAERAKARALVDLLAQRRDLAPPPSVDDRVRQLFAEATTVDSAVGIADNAEVLRGVKLVADARVTLATAAPEAASLVAVQNVDVGGIASRLAADESLIDYYWAGDKLYAFVLNGTSVQGFTIPAQGLEEEIRAFREAIVRRDVSSTELGQKLYGRLLRPVTGAVKGARLTIAPHGPLHYLPFAALADGEQYLIDRYALRLVPSASTIAYLRPGQSKKVGTLLALGNPDLGKRELDLPNAQIEATTIAAMFPNSRALVRNQATKRAVEDLANGFSMLHFATHGRFDARAPLSSGLYLAKGVEADGVLTVSDLYSLRWDVDLVTLSACETGLGEIANGDDVIGLTRGFLYAGARSIVASLWEVDDAATAHLMASFYRALATTDKREALRRAQIATRQQYPQPWFWAAFNVLGRAD